MNRKGKHQLHLESQDFHLFRKRGLKRHQIRGHIEDPSGPRLHLDGDQPHYLKRRRLRWKSVVKWGAVALIVLLIILFTWGYVWFKSKESRMRVEGVDEALDATRPGQPVTTLVMGADGGVHGEGAIRSDMIMLVGYSPKNNRVAIISIPRDSRIQIPGHEGFDKISAARSYGGQKLAIQTVKELTGLDINHYVEIDFAGIRHIVDSLGGLRMHVDVAIDDKYAGRVPAGDVVLTGDQALAFMRARHDVNAVSAGDIQRVRDQRELLQVMLRAISGNRNPIKAAELIDVASKNLKTDLSFTELLSLGRRLQGRSGPLTMTTAPGRPGLVSGNWYYQLDTAQFQSILATFKAGQRVDESTEQLAQSSEASVAGIRLALLNGAGTLGLAGQVAQEPAKAGYVAIQTGNAENTSERTTVYYSGGNSEKAGKVAADLEGVQDPVIESNDAMTTSHGVDVLVILGSDYKMP